jgi:hypothetical protein
MKPSCGANKEAVFIEVILRPLAEGEHTIAITLPGPGAGETVSITYRLSVMSGA